MKHYFTFLYTWLFLISHSLSADSILFDCSVATEFPVIATERCQEFIVDRSPASSGPETIKATACSIETVDPEDKTVFIYTNSPNWPVWLCRDKKEWEGLQQPETPTLTVTIVDKQTGDPDDEIPAASGSSYGDDFFDDRRPRKPGMPGVTPILLGTASAGWLPVGLMSFAFGLELSELSENSPVLFQEGFMSDDSGILVIISGSQQRVYRKKYQLGNWHLVGQTNSKALPSTEEQFDDFIAEDKLVRALVGVFGWEWEINNKPQMDVHQGEILGMISCPKEKEEGGKKEDGQKKDTENKGQSRTPVILGGGGSGRDEEGASASGGGSGDKPPSHPSIATRIAGQIAFEFLSPEHQAELLLDSIEKENEKEFVNYSRKIWHQNRLMQVWLYLVKNKPNVFRTDKHFLNRVFFYNSSYCNTPTSTNGGPPFHNCINHPRNKLVLTLLNHLMIHFIDVEKIYEAIAVYDFWKENHDSRRYDNLSREHWQSDPVVGFGKVRESSGWRNNEGSKFVFYGDSRSSPLWVALTRGNWEFIYHLFLNQAHPSLLFNSYFCGDGDCYTLLTSAIFLGQEKIALELNKLGFGLIKGFMIEGWRTSFRAIPPLAYALLNGKDHLAEVFFASDQFLEQQDFVSVAKSLFIRKRADLFEMYVLGSLKQPIEKETFKRLLAETAHHFPEYTHKLIEKCHSTWLEVGDDTSTYTGYFLANNLKVFLQALEFFPDLKGKIFGDISGFIFKVVTFNNEELFSILREMAVEPLRFSLDAIDTAVKEKSKMLGFLLEETKLPDDHQERLVSLAADSGNLEALKIFLTKGYRFNVKLLQRGKLQAGVRELLASELSSPTRFKETSTLVDATPLASHLALDLEEGLSLTESTVPSAPPIEPPPSYYDAIKDNP